jgi:signal transduction histidine kinase
MVLQDHSGTALIEMDPQNAPVVAGQKIVLDGTSSKGRGGASLAIGNLLLAADLSPSGREKVGSALLQAGKHPISVSWFDGNVPNRFEILYDSTNMNMFRRSIPDSLLFHPVVTPPAGTTNWRAGLDYHAYEGLWSSLPDFHQLKAVKRGTAANFDLGVKSRSNFTGLEFSGYLELAREATYTFYLVLQGPDQLFIEQPQIHGLETTGVPAPQRIIPGQILSEQDRSRWAQVEGVVTFVSKEQYGGLRLELTSGQEHIDAEIADGSAGASALLLGSRVQITGICQSGYSLVGQRSFMKFWVPGLKQVELLEVAPASWTSRPVLTIKEVTALSEAAPRETLFRVRGKVQSVEAGHSMVIKDQTGQLEVETTQPLPENTGDYVEVMGSGMKRGKAVFLGYGFFRKVEGAEDVSEPLPTLTTAEAVKQLSRSDAMRGYPVKIRGVITWSGGTGAVLQDSTMGVFIDEFKPENSREQRVGEYWEVEGRTTAQFSPMVRALKVVRLGEASMPVPVRPTWDQLVNGTLDTQYVEIQGVVTSVGNAGLTLLTHGGRIIVDLPEKKTGELKAYENSLIRVRGCLWAVKDEITHVLRVGEIQIHDALIDLDQERPANPFAAPLKRASEFLLFDARASAFQRIKVAGQIIHEREGEYFLMDGTNGLRFTTKVAAPLQVGDQVEVVGFPALDGRSPALREAVVRYTGHSLLPEPVFLSKESSLSGDHDSTLIKVRAQLVNFGIDQADQILGLQMGPHVIVARLNQKAGTLQSIPIGSELELVGVYDGRATGQGEGQVIDSFELLLNSPSAVRILALPSWWTIRRMLVIVAILVGVLITASIWIRMLQRQVGLRTVQLRNEIEGREQIERKHALEAERSRIARDLHDDLGSSLTEISLLADAGPGQPPSLEKAHRRFQAIESKARAVTSALDVIVWLVNPGKNQLQFLVGYLVSYAEDFFSTAGINCRVRVPVEVPQLSFEAEVRHSLFLAVKEILTNVVRHSRATDALMEIDIDEHQMTITISDNGRGFEFSDHSGGDGLVNLRKRMADLKGRCKITPQPGAGTKISLIVPLPVNNTATITNEL